MYIDDLVPKCGDRFRRQDSHIPGQHHQVGPLLNQLLLQPLEMFFEMIVRVPRKRQPRLGGDRFEIGVIGVYTRNLAVQSAMLEVFDQLFQAMWLFADEQRDLLHPPLALQIHAHFHIDARPKLDQPGNQLRQIAVQIGQIDEHIHHEKSVMDSLANVFNVDATVGHISGKLRDNALLIFSKHADNG